MRNDAKLVRNLEICRRHFGKEKMGYKRLSALYGVTRERILMICQRREIWEDMAREAKKQDKG